MFGRGAAAGYDVGFYTNVGQFRTETSEIRREWQRTTNSLSTDAIRAQVAQEKLDKAIARHGATSLQAKNATLAYRREMAELGGQAGRTGNSLRSAEHDAERFGRGMLAGSGILGHFGRAAIFASSSLLGGYGLVYALKTVIGAAREGGVAISRVQNALKNSGLSWSQYGGEIEKATQKLVHSTAFQDDELLTGLAQLIRRFGDVDQAVTLAGDAADVARGRNIDYASAVNLIIKASNGQTGALRRLGLDVGKVTTEQDKLKASGEKLSAQQKAAAKAADDAATREGLLAAVRAKYHGQAADYLTTDAGKQAKFNAELHQSEEIIGNALTPALSHYVGDLGEYLDKANRTGQLQRDVNRAMRDGTEVVHGIRDAFNDVKPAIDGVISELGGIEHTVETALVIGAILKVRKFANSFGLIRTASHTTRDAIVADAALEQAALDKLLLAGGGKGGGGGGIFPVLLRGGKGLARVGRVGGDLAIVTAAAELIQGALGSQPKHNQSFLNAIEHPFKELKEIGYYLRHPFGHAADQGGRAKPLHFLDVLPAIQAGALTEATLRELRPRFPDPADYNGALALLRSLQPTNDRTDARDRRGVGATAGTTAGGPPPIRTSITARLDNELLDAQINSPNNTADDRRALEDQRAYLEGLLKQPGLTQTNIRDIKTQLVSVTNDIRQIDQENARKAAAAQRAAAAAARKRQALYRAGIASDVHQLENAAKTELAHVIRTDAKKGRLPTAAEIAAAPAHTALEAFLRKESHDAGLTPAERDRYAGEIAGDRLKAARAINAETVKHRKAEISRLEKIPVELQIQEKLAKTEQQKLAILNRELDAVKAQVAKLKQINAGKDAIDRARLTEAGIQEKINKLKPTGSAAEFFAEAASEAALYGSNIGGRGTVLSGQDARGALGRIALHLKAIERHSRTTAAATSGAYRDRPTMAHAARALASAGI